MAATAAKQDRYNTLILMNAFNSSPVTPSELLAPAKVECFNEIIIIIPKDERVDHDKAERPWKSWMERIDVAVKEIQTSPLQSNLFIHGYAPASLFIYLGICLKNERHVTIINHNAKTGELEMWPIVWEGRKNYIPLEAFDLVSNRRSFCSHDIRSAVFFSLNRNHKLNEKNLPSIEELTVTSVADIVPLKDLYFDPAQHVPMFGDMFREQLDNIYKSLPSRPSFFVASALPNPLNFELGRSFNIHIFSAIFFVDLVHGAYQIAWTGIDFPVDVSDQCTDVIRRL